jgi:NAD-dependent deacetylase
MNPGECADLIRHAGTVVALSGAGLSTAAGIPDFRGPRGLYVTRRYDPEKVFDIQAFRLDPRPFFEFSRDFLGIIDGIRPTTTHRFLAALESAGRLNTVVTQNIDGLHQRAGSDHVIPIHGDYERWTCQGCAAHAGLAEMAPRVAAEEVPRCRNCGEVVKPDIVFFGEPVRGLDAAALAVSEADLLLVLGSSLVVYPAAALPDLAKGLVVVVNQGAVGLPSAAGRHFVDADLDQFFSAVAACLGMDVQPSW